MSAAPSRLRFASEGDCQRLQHLRLVIDVEVVALDQG